MSRLEENKMSDLFKRTMVISVAEKKDHKKKALIFFELTKVRVKQKDIELKLLNLQLFNYLIQINDFGKSLTADSEIFQSKSFLEVLLNIYLK